MLGGLDLGDRGDLAIDVGPCQVIGPSDAEQAQDPAFELGLRDTSHDRQLVARLLDEAQRPDRLQHMLDRLFSKLVAVVIANEDQQLDYHGDKGLEFVSALQEVTVYWGRIPNSQNNI